jgi:hypothetical protein
MDQNEPLADFKLQLYTLCRILDRTDPASCFDLLIGKFDKFGAEAALVYIKHYV